MHTLQAGNFSNKIEYTDNQQFATIVDVDSEDKVPYINDGDAKFILSGKLKENEILTVSQDPENTDPDNNNLITTPKGNYSEAAHIKAKRDKGDDHEENVLSLCPNCHKQFDKGALWLTDKLEIIHFEKGNIGNLFIDSNHILNIENIRFHREKHS